MQLISVLKRSSEPDKIKNKQVQIDSRDGNGGISPSIRTPMTWENALRAAQGEDVELEHAVEVINNYAR